MLSVVPGFQDLFTRLGLSRCADVVARFQGEAISTRPKFRIVRQVELPDASGASVSVFYKQYEYAPPSWEFVGRASKAVCEFRNYGRLARIGVRAAERIACGEERDWLGRLCRAFIITRAIPNACLLGEYFVRECADRANPETRRRRRALARQLADMLRRSHDAGFFHRDLFWRNILVNRDPSGEPQLWWIDCPRGRRGRVLTRFQRIRDLASVDTGAAVYCTRTERLQFLKDYLNRPQLDKEVRSWLHAVDTYRLGHWPDGLPEDDPRKLS